MVDIRRKTLGRNIIKYKMSKLVNLRIIFVTFLSIIVIAFVRLIFFIIAIIITTGNFVK